MLKPFSLFLAVAVLVLSSAIPAAAQSRAELAAQNAALKTRVERLEQRMLTGDPAAERLMARVDTLETTLRSLRGEVERLSYERDLAKSRTEALEGDIRILQDLATRMKIHLDAVDMAAAGNPYGGNPYGPAPQVDDTYTSGPPTVSAIPEAPTSRQRNFELPPASSNSANDAAQLGELGQTRLAEGDYAGAEEAFGQYLQFNPDAVDADVINFWLGEARYVRGQFNGAADAYVTSLQLAPQGMKAPDALVKLGAALREMGQTAEACGALASFSAQFPNAPVSAQDKARRESERTGC